MPWGSSKGDDDLGGYHLVWARDLVEAAGGLLAAGDGEGARQALVYLISTQEQDGHWPQNMWLDGAAFWSGIQMDETAFPILLADALRRSRQLDAINVLPMVLKAAKYLVCNGPVTPQDRWEEDGGFSPFTLAVEVAALLAAAGFAEDASEAAIAGYLRETADLWNDNVERWTYVSGGELAQQAAVDGYYVRIAPPESADAASPMDGFVPIKNRPPDQASAPCEQIISVDALALVRFGLRSASDPRIINTVKAIDLTLKTETSTGPAWHRYTGDGYGEHEDGSPFDGTGVGRGWPLFAGERGHYELALGKRTEARSLLRTMERQASATGLMPEQVWDEAGLPERELFNGRPAGSAMPLVWAHAEYIKLLRSLRDNRVHDMPPAMAQRYQIEKVKSPYGLWRFNLKSRRITAGRVLRVELKSSAVVHWSSDGWRNTHEEATVDSGLGIHFANLPTQGVAPNSQLLFTFRWLTDDRWEGTDFPGTRRTSSRRLSRFTLRLV